VISRLMALFGSDDLPPGFTDEQIERAWTNALELWGEDVVLSAPKPVEASADDAHWPGDDPLAYIDMKSRQVHVNYELLAEIGAADSLEAVLAHEIGHHIAFPRTLGQLATLQVIEKRLLPYFSGSMVNLFLDLQVNEFVGCTDAEALAAVYRGFREHRGQSTNPIFAFYLAIYESLWGLDESTLVGPDAAEQMDADYPAWRADARMFAQTFYGLAGTYLQFAYFCGVFIRYICEPSTGEEVARPVVPLGDDAPHPSPADYAGAIRSVEGGRAGEVIDEARDRGWVDASEIEDETDAFDLIDSLVHAGHGRGSADFRRELTERHYAHLVDRHLIELPRTEDPPEEPLIPQTVEPWEAGDDPRSIDWVASTLQRGPLAAAMPQKRIFARDDEASSETGPTSLEIYLDTSGSMPAPTRAFNAMTMAAQILSASAIRADGRVRAVIYSDGDPMTSEWMYDEATARRFLLHYAGGGTYFPFDLLRKRAREDADVMRVIISDAGFAMDLRREEGPEAMAYAAERSKLVVVVLSHAQGYLEGLRETSDAVLSHPRIRHVGVEHVADLVEAARRLADALIEPRR
jgi:hypothetical protein